MSLRSKARESRADLKIRAGTEEWRGMVQMQYASKQATTDGPESKAKKNEHQIFNGGTDEKKLFRCVELVLLDFIFG